MYIQIASSNSLPFTVLSLFICFKALLVIIVIYQRKSCLCERGWLITTLWSVIFCLSSSWNLTTSYSFYIKGLEMGLNMHHMLYIHFFSLSARSEATREVPLRGGQHPVWGWREARWRSAEAVWEVWLQGVFYARCEPCCDHQLSLHHPSVPRARALQSVPQNCFLHWGTYSFKLFKQ